jgi:hypothetical protein
LKQENAFLAMLFRIVPEYDFRKVPENNDRLILNRTHHLLGYADDVKLLNTTKKNTEVLLVTSNEVGLK